MNTNVLNMKWTIFVLVCFVVCAFCVDLPCSKDRSIDISDGILLQNGDISHNNLTYTENEYFIITNEQNTTEFRGCICLLRPCIRKCCPLGHTYANSSCEPIDDPRLTSFGPPVYKGDMMIANTSWDMFGVIVGDRFCGDRPKYALNPVMNEGDEFYIQKNGQLFAPAMTSVGEDSEYCVELFPEQPKTGIPWPDDEAQYLAILCFEDEDSIDQILFIIFPVGMLISSPFLLATFLVYAFIPELRNLHGKCLMNYVFGLFIGYVALAINQMTFNAPEYEISMEMCHAMAFVIYFFMLLTFLWLNVMCIDIWLTFRGFKMPRIGRRSAENRRFLFYFLYAWGSSIVLTSICAILQYHPDIPDHIYRPNIGASSCWFEGRTREFLFFYLPAIFLVCANLILFTNTSLKIVQINRETAMLQSGDSRRHDQYNKDKQRFMLYLKLFLVMGINWIAELLSFVIAGSKWIWMFTDCLNTFIGIYIFIVFVWKKKIRNLIVKRYRFLRYGSTITQTRTSSKYNTSNMASCSIGETDKMYLSEATTTTVLKMKDMV